MAKRKQTKKSSKSQAWGVLFLGIGVLLFIAIATFNVNDPVNLNVQNNIVKAQNWIGPLGASISYVLMQWTLGYPVLVLPALLILFSIGLITGKPLPALGKLSGLSLIWAFLISILLAMPAAVETSGHITEYYPSGLIGGFTASRLVIYLGEFGSLSVLFLAVIVMLFVSTPIELGRLFRGISALGRSISDGVRAFFERRKEKREQRKQRRLEKKQQEPYPVSDLEAVKPHIQPQPEPKPLQINIDTPPEPEPVPEIPKPEPPEQEMDPGVQVSLEDILNKLEEKDAPSEVDFEVTEEKRDPILDYDKLVKESIVRYKFPSIDLLTSAQGRAISVTREELHANAKLLEEKLQTFNVEAKVVSVTAGPVITLYELQPATGVKVNAIVNLANDLAMVMEARGIRIIAPIPGKAAVGIEIPNRNPQMVYLRELIVTEKFSKTEVELPLALGKTISGEAYIIDLTKMPHLLIAGATGSGKSVGINTIIMSLLYAVNPAKVKFMMVDPKMLELSIYRTLRNHYLIWRPDLDEEVLTKPNNAVSMLNSMVLEMDRRYVKLSSLNVRNIVEYNKKVKKGGVKVEDENHQQLPYIVIIIDELADLMMVSSKEVETPIARIAQKARAVGLHLIVATQRPSVNVITGTIKANFPARIAYQVATKVDSRTVLDMNGAEQLLGNGDMLFLPPGQPKPTRLQNPFVSTEEVEKVVDHINRQKDLPYYSVPQPGNSNRGGMGGGNGGEGSRDVLYEQARAVVVYHKQGSISFLQRKLKIGYSRAASLIDELEENGVVGPANGSKPREVILTQQELQNM